VTLAALALLVGVASASAQPQIDGPLPAPLPLFPASNWWNTDISSAPVDSNSDAFIAFINNGGTRHLHPDWAGSAHDPSDPDLIYGFPYISVDSTQPLMPVTFVDYPNESDTGAPGRPLGIRFPKRRNSASAGWKGEAPRICWTPDSPATPAIDTCSSSIATIASFTSCIARTGT
jgi:hypothetical protein